MSPLNILVVDDSPDDREAIRRMLTKSASDIVVEEAATLREAQAALVGKQFSCVLLDYRLPDAAGVDAVTRLSEIAPGTPIVMITGQGDESVAAEAMRSGAADYVGKSLLADGAVIRRILQMMRDAPKGARRPRALRVLVVDDSPDDRELFTRALRAIESLRYDVQAVGSGAEALKVVEDNPPDCMVLDYSLPGLNGLQLLERIRKTNPYLPIVLVTGQGSEAIAVEAIRAGAQDYMPKSAVTREDLHRCVRASVEKAQQQARIESARNGLEQLARELKASNAELERFSTEATGDLRQSLNALRGLPDWLSRDLTASFGQVPDSMSGSLHLIRIQGDRMGELIERLIAHASSRDTLEASVAERIRELEGLNTDLEKTVAQRDLLLAEVYHRVKNNLQFIDAMLAIEASQSGEAVLEEPFERVRRRIKSLSLVHEQILQAPDLETLDLRGFLTGVCSHLADGLGIDERSVTLTTDIETLPINLDRAIPFALIVNELVSNSIKHAFPNGRAGTITVSVVREGRDGATLTVRDDGVGTSESSSSMKTWSGGTIMRALVGQLKATLEISSDNGTVVTVAVPSSAQPRLH